MRTLICQRASWLRPCSIALLFWLSGCASLAPVELEPEYTAPPAMADAWAQLEASRPGDWFELLNEGPDALDWRLRAIDSATDSIDLQTFLWTFDSTGVIVLDHLLAAAERGVQVKMLVDDTFLLGQDAALLQVAHHPNIEYRVFNPYKRRSSGFATRMALNLAEFHRLDHRMHNKAMIVDNRIAIVGGRNIADEYFGLHADANFRDVEVITGGPFVLQVSASFDTYWNDRWSLPIEMLSHVEAVPADLEVVRHMAVPATEVHSEESADERMQRWLDIAANAMEGKPTLFADEPPDENPALLSEAPVEVANALADLFDNADAEILIVSAYLIPTPELEGAVNRAVERGVRVRMLTNSIRSNNHLTAHSAYRKHIESLLNNGAELHEVRIDAEDRGIYMMAPVDEKDLALHAKALVIDFDKVFIGSANLDPRSLRINTEMGLVIESPELNARMRGAIAPDFERRNAWELDISEDGEVLWISNDATLNRQPAASTMQRIEDWFFAHLPIEDEM